MASTPEILNASASAIQLALAPAFLLTGIAGMLAVMTGRLARIIDRGRALAEGEIDPSMIKPGSIDDELRALDRRRHYSSVAITASTIAALLLCLVIAMLFLGVMIDAPLGSVVGALFAAAMLALIAGLAFFLREVHLAMQSIRIPDLKLD
ncbi:DUF2721 domain-containing protein [Microbulbifer yueqingensis]|uniref:DUF2721 domain-containing protein n=1 Tax=Microbulbifer yueqingensis TaxID=658219 RepID=A0A1G9CKF9_9GAMM|nr:DUF2721 domain-containing protein [Microbulbifer yueqingensis]SDK52076.1 Protein of unknown function [Microbulbifer yueqingensis]